ncbi:MAG TPA: FG-GAP repeat protein, partial [Terriglobales bacterium]|nr:FG-GAP repeat protein [Terriglobales bacterium]
MQQRNHRIVTIVTSLCLLVVVVTLGVMTAPNGQAIAALQGASATPFLTPALKGTLVPVDDPQPNAGFGSAVSTSNGVILVGAPHSYANQGTAYIFDQPNFTAWDQAAELIAPDGDPGDLFGSAVSIGIGPTGMVAVVGAPGDDSAGVDAGAVYVYVRDGTIGWTLTARINSPDAAAGDQFGYSVGYSDGNIIVGAPFADAGGYTDIGAAYVFVGSVSNWGLDQKLDYTLMYLSGNGFRADNRHFGYAVDIFGNEAVVSSVLADDSNNHVHVLNRALGKWYFHLTLQPLDNGIGYGRAVSIYHDTVAVGAPLYDDPIFGVDSGRVFV